MKCKSQNTKAVISDPSVMLDSELACKMLLDVAKVTIPFRGRWWDVIRRLVGVWLRYDDWFPFDMICYIC